MSVTPDPEHFRKRHVKGVPGVVYDYITLDDPDHPLYDKPRKIIHRVELNFWAFATICVGLLIVIGFIERIIR